jgi:hypothetical protein
MSRPSGPLVLSASHAQRQCKADPVVGHVPSSGQIPEHQGSGVGVRDDHLRNEVREHGQEQDVG